MKNFLKLVNPHTMEAVIDLQIGGSMNRISLLGYDKLGENGKEGIRYAWNVDNSKYLLESAAFINKTKGVVEDIAGYTTSVGLGCILKHLGYSCKFCRTGNLLPFVNLLTAKEIAKQNILMVLTDVNCSDHANLKNSKREFAYMGQGEPGYSYQQVRLAIKITDYVMKELGQTVYRHIIATSGIIEMLYAIQSDLVSNFFDSKITLHYSLHALKNRSDIMPINLLYPYESILKELKKISEITKDRVCLGVLLFNKFKPNYFDKEFTTKLEDIKEIFKIIDSEHFRFSFCEYNSSIDIGSNEEFLQEEAYRICDYVKSRGYESKLFSSFGKKENTACGMLAGKLPEYNISQKWIELERYAEELIVDALANI